jgi:hypothetical protein
MAFDVQAMMALKRAETGGDIKKAAAEPENGNMV